MRQEPSHRPWSSAILIPRPQRGLDARVELGQLVGLAVGVGPSFEVRNPRVDFRAELVQFESVQLAGLFFGSDEGDGPTVALDDHGLAPTLWG